VHFLCGRRAVRDYQHKSALLKCLSENLTAGETEILPNVRKLQQESKQLRRECHELTERLLDYDAAALLAEREQIGTLQILEKVFEGRSAKELAVLAAKILKQSPSTVLLFGGTVEGKASLVFHCSEELPFHMGELMKTACALLDGQGGGHEHQAQGGGPALENLGRALHMTRTALT